MIQMNQNGFYLLRRKFEYNFKTNKTFYNIIYSLKETIKYK